MLRKPTFHKNFTRNTSLILQQLWLICMDDGIAEIVSRNPYRPSVIDYIHNGTCEIWENDAAVDYIRKQFAAFSRKKPREAIVMLKRFKERNKLLEKVWKRGILKSLPELKNFISLVLDNMLGDIFILYMAEEKNIPAIIRRKAYALRDGDHYFSSTNKVLVNTIKKLFPKAKNYINVIRYKDLDKIPSLVELKRRSKNYVCCRDYWKVETLAEYSLKTGFRFIDDKVKIIRGILKGQAANSGRAIGRVKLVFTTNDLGKVKKNDILISPMTTANFMPAIRKAAAIVTDEGGTLCHAAIVARELKKPCLIATKIATKVFKDNDLVEVDVYNKTIRKVKKT